MLKASAGCPLCSRTLAASGGLGGEGLPRHLDPLLGTPCPASGQDVAALLGGPMRPAGAEPLDEAGPWPRYRRRGHARPHGPRP